MAESTKRPGNTFAAQGAGNQSMLVSEIFLQENFDDAGLKKNYSFILVAVVLHLFLFLVTFPEMNYRVRAEKPNRPATLVRVYTPPPPPKKERPKVEPEVPEKVTLPDPTPDKPEPIIAPDAEPEPEPIDPDVDIRIGDPEPPPATGPLIPDIGGVTTPELIAETKVEPIYPDMARRTRVQGVVILQVVVRKDGTVGDIKVLGVPAANLGFSAAAVAAVSQWRYRPAMQNGRPVDVFMTVRADFTVE